MQDPPTREHARAHGSTRSKESLDEHHPRAVPRRAVPGLSPLPRRSGMDSEGDDVFGLHLLSARFNRDSASKQSLGASNGMKSAASEAPAPTGKDHGAAAAAPPVVPVVTKEELQAVVSASVQAALDQTFGKFVKSLRTVLEDLGKRVDHHGQSLQELQGALDGISQQMDSQVLNFHSRFTALDVAAKDIDRGVQVLRDKQELHEAQAMLAKFEGAHAAPATTSGTTNSTGGASPAVPAAANPLPAAAATGTAPPPQPVAVVAAVQSPPVQPVQLATSQPGTSVYTAPVVPVAVPPPMHPQQQPHMLPPMPTAPQPGPPLAPAHPAMAGGRGAPPPAGVYSQHLQQPPGMVLLGQAAYYAPPSQQVQAPVGPMPGGPPPRTGMPGTDPYGPGGHPYGLPTPHNAHPVHSAPAMQPPALLPPPHMHSGNSWAGPSGGSGTPSGPLPQPTGASYPAPALAYPAPTQPSAYPAYPRASGPPPSMHSMGAGGSGASGPSPQGRPTTRSVRLDDVIQDITQMGFKRHDVIAVVNKMQNQGQAIDLNVVIDKLANGRF